MNSEIRSAEILDIDPRESPARRRPARDFPPVIPAGEPDPAPTPAATRPTGTRGRRVRLLPRRRAHAPGTRPPPRIPAGLSLAAIEGPAADASLLDYLQRRRGLNPERFDRNHPRIGPLLARQAISLPVVVPPPIPTPTLPPVTAANPIQVPTLTPIGPPRSSAGADRPRAVDRGHDPGAGRLGRLVATGLATSGPTLIRSASPGSGRLVRANAPGSPRVRRRGRGREPFGACGSGRSGPAKGLHDA